MAYLKKAEREAALAAEKAATEAPATEAPATEAPATEAQEVNLVQMVREQPQHPGGPVTADVHPGEVDTWRVHGWVPRQ